MVVVSDFRFVIVWGGVSNLPLWFEVGFCAPVACSGDMLDCIVVYLLVALFCGWFTLRGFIVVWFGFVHRIFSTRCCCNCGFVCLMDLILGMVTYGDLFVYVCYWIVWFTVLVLLVFYGFV